MAQALTIVKTKQGKDKVAHRGFLYNLVRTTKSAAKWRCELYQARGANRSNNRVLL